MSSAGTTGSSKTHTTTKKPQALKSKTRRKSGGRVASVKRNAKTRKGASKKMLSGKSKARSKRTALKSAPVPLVGKAALQKRLDELLEPFTRKNRKSRSADWPTASKEVVKLLDTYKTPQALEKTVDMIIKQMATQSTVLVGLSTLLQEVMKRFPQITLTSLITRMDSHFPLKAPAKEEGSDTCIQYSNALSSLLTASLPVVSEPEKVTVCMQLLRKLVPRWVSGEPFGRISMNLIQKIPEADLRTIIAELVPLLVVSQQWSIYNLHLMLTLEPSFKAEVLKLNPRIKFIQISAPVVPRLLSFLKTKVGLEAIGNPHLWQAVVRSATRQKNSLDVLHLLWKTFVEEKPFINENRITQVRLTLSAAVFCCCSREILIKFLADGKVKLICSLLGMRGLPLKYSWSWSHQMKASPDACCLFLQNFLGFALKPEGGTSLPNALCVKELLKQTPNQFVKDYVTSLMRTVLSSRDKSLTSWLLVLIVSGIKILVKRACIDEDSLSSYLVSFFSVAHIQKPLPSILSRLSGKAEWLFSHSVTETAAFGSTLTDLISMLVKCKPLTEGQVMWKAGINTLYNFILKCSLNKDIWAHVHLKERSKTQLCELLSSLTGLWTEAENTTNGVVPAHLGSLFLLCKSLIVYTFSNSAALEPLQKLIDSLSRLQPLLCKAALPKLHTYSPEENESFSSLTTAFLHILKLKKPWILTPSFKSFESISPFIPTSSAVSLINFVTGVETEDADRLRSDSDSDDDTDFGSDLEGESGSEEADNEEMSFNDYRAAADVEFDDDTMLGLDKYYSSVVKGGKPEGEEDQLAVDEEWERRRATKYLDFLLPANMTNPMLLQLASDLGDMALQSQKMEKSSLKILHNISNLLLGFTQFPVLEDKEMVTAVKEAVVGLTKACLRVARDNLSTPVLVTFQFASYISRVVMHSVKKGGAAEPLLSPEEVTDLEEKLAQPIFSYLSREPSSFALLKTVILASDMGRTLLELCSRELFADKEADTPSTHFKTLDLLCKLLATQTCTNALSLVSEAAAYVLAYCKRLKRNDVTPVVATQIFHLLKCFHALLSTSLETHSREKVVELLPENLLSELQTVSKKIAKQKIVQMCRVLTELITGEKQQKTEKVRSKKPKDGGSGKEAPNKKKQAPTNSAEPTTATTTTTTTTSTTAGSKRPPPSPTANTTKSSPKKADLTVKSAKKATKPSPPKPKRTKTTTQANNKVNKKV